MNRTEVKIALDIARTSTNLSEVSKNLKKVVNKLDKTVQPVVGEFIAKIDACIAAEGTPQYRGLKAGISPNSRGGQKYHMALNNEAIRLSKVEDEFEAGVTEGMAEVAKKVKDKKEPKPKEPKEKKIKEPKTMNSCLCGCGELVVGTFKQGHDARVKGWLLKFARGQEDLVPADLKSNPALPGMLTRWSIPTDGDGNLAFGVVAPPK